MKPRFIIVALIVTIWYTVQSCEKENNKTNTDDPIDNDTIVNDTSNNDTIIIDTITSIPNRNDLLIPLAVGNTWNYGGTASSVIDNKYQIIYNNETINVFTFGNSQYDDRFLLSYDSFGNIYCNGATIPLDTLHTKTLYLSDTCPAGTIWDCFQVVVSGSSATSVDTVEILRTLSKKCFVSDTIITIPLGQFHCKGFRYSFPDDSDTREYVDFYSKGVGLIKHITNVNNVKRDSAILKSYYINND